MPQAPFSWQLRVRFSDTDASGRIHYTSMLRFFEAAEVEFLRRLGIEYASIENEHTGYPRVHVECTYTGAVQDDDVVDGRLAWSGWAGLLSRCASPLVCAARTRRMAGSPLSAWIVKRKSHGRSRKPLRKLWGAMRRSARPREPKAPQ